MKRPFSSLSTEQRNPRTVGIDSLSIPEILDVLNREDEAIAVAVGAEKPKIARAVEL
ncbi:MAG: N-acetylmuramic acid 6-phosphate etherase, partial [Planctomycetota bacterium]